VARELIILPRFKRDYRTARKHPEFDLETLEYIFDVLISGTRPPEPFREHRLRKRALNLTGFTECHLGADLLLVYRVRRNAVVLHPIGTHQQLFTTRKPRARRSTRRRRKVPT
jgi:addiction module RelE/StbE family toxin